MKLQLGAALLLSIWMSGCSTETPWDPPDEIREQLQGILGGEETEHWPAVGAYAIDGGHNGMCTAVLVAPDWVLTAAHCAEDAGDGDTFIMAPNLDTANLGDLHGVAEAFPHPGYDGHSQHPHDIALLRLQDPIEDVDFIPVNGQDADSWTGTSLHYVGYGANTYFGGPGAGLKRETDIQISWVTSHEFATYTLDTNYCSGDSGGPGFVELEGRWYVAGVVSSVYAKQNGQDMCEGGGWSMRVDAELGFMDDHYDVEIEPENWYQAPGEGDDDDDSAAAGDDDDSAAGDDDDSAIPEPTDDDDDDGCQCLSAGRATAPLGVTAALLLAMAMFVRRGGRSRR
jgi:V8-like Glu-specific endopeptidase